LGSTSIAELSGHILSKLASHPLGRSLLQETSVLEALKARATLLQKNKDMSSFFRILDVLAEIAAQNNEAFHLLELSGCLQLFIDQLKLEDPLELLNVLILLENLMKSVSGLQYYVSTGTVDYLIKLISTDDGMDGLITERVFQLFRNICRQGEEQTVILLKYPLIEGLSKNVENKQFEMVIISTVGAIGRTQAGLNALVNNKSLIENIALVVVDSLMDTKVNALACFTEIFENRITKTPLEVNQLNSIYHMISTEEPTATLLMDYLKKPFYEIRKASYSLLFSVAQYSWGALSIVNTPGLFELLLNRQKETYPEGFSWKFSIFQRLVDLADSKSILGLERYYDALQYLKNGIIFVQAQSVPVLKDEVW
jgi:26S proteasome non-ATPase regulatory subunit 5